jgi:hypothetical protein
MEKRAEIPVVVRHYSVWQTTPWGKFKQALVAGPPSPQKAVVPLPPTVVIVPLPFTFRIPSARGDGDLDGWYADLPMDPLLPGFHGPRRAKLIGTPRQSSYDLLLWNAQLQAIEADAAQ